MRRGGAPRGAAGRARRPRTLLLDLDGTLLDVDMPAFLDGFFALAADRLAAPARRRETEDAMIEAARGMFASRDPARTLDLVFLEALADAVGSGAEQLRAGLAAFHAGELEQMAPLVRPVPAAAPLLERAAALGCELVLATNPVFFRDAIRARVRWAGLDERSFAFITAAESMHAAKPRPEYYTEVLLLAGREPAACLMVGDDRRMDLAAAAAGIPTWLAVREGDDGGPVAGADFVGTLEELTDWLERTPER